MYSSQGGRLLLDLGQSRHAIPQAVGWAMASAYKGDDAHRGGLDRRRLDGGGDFHHALTFASSIARRSSSTSSTTNGRSRASGHRGGEIATFAARGHRLRHAGLRVDGNDFLAVYAATQWAAERARANLGPTLIEHVTYRAERAFDQRRPRALSPKPTRKPGRWAIRSSG
jgi:2-oxoisovalerate dehydrogenase E1 component alpha subunit